MNDSKIFLRDLTEAAKQLTGVQKQTLLNLSHSLKATLNEIEDDVISVKNTLFGESGSLQEDDSRTATDDITNIVKRCLDQSQRILRYLQEVNGGLK